MTAPEPPDWLLPAWDALPTTPTRSPARSPAPGGTFGLRVRTVSEVSRAIRDRVRSDDGLRDLWVEGEVGRVTVSTAGHAYFTLKDARAQLQCVWFRDDRVRSPFQPQTGLQVVAHGRMDLFEPQGALQLYVESLQPSGFGNLAVRFEQLKARLAEEGLFDAARKRPLPSRPRTIAVVTSPTGAVWRDVCNVLARRWPMARVVLVACQVQGEGAPQSIVACPPPARALDRGGAGGRTGRRRTGRDDPGAGRRLARGPVVVQRRAGRARGRRPPGPGGVRRRPRGGRDAGRLRGRRPRPDAVGGGGAGRARPPRGGLGRPDSWPGAWTRRWSAGWWRRGGDLDAERRALARLEPRAQLAGSRERAGLLLDRAARVVDDRLAGAARAQERLAARLAPLLPGRLAAERTRLDGLALRAPRVLEVPAPRGHRRAGGDDGIAGRARAQAQRWSAATRSSGAARTTRSCAIRRTHPRARPCGSPSPAGRSPRPATGPVASA